MKFASQQSETVKNRSYARFYAIYTLSDIFWAVTNIETVEKHEFHEIPSGIVKKHVFFSEIIIYSTSRKTKVYIPRQCPKGRTCQFLAKTRR